MMAIRVLLDHDVPESNITLLSILSAKTGAQSIAYAFPEVRYSAKYLMKCLSSHFRYSDTICYDCY